MVRCECAEPHVPRRVVLTGGPGAGKTAVLELIRQAFCIHVKVLPEAAGIVFGGGFPRGTHPELRRAAQRAIFHVQRELERQATVGNPVVVLCDRGTIDGLAYWVGPDDYWSSLGTTLEEQLARYDAVIHLRTPGEEDGYNQRNPLRIETPGEAAIIDEKIAVAWSRHSRRHEVPAAPDFVTKATQAMHALRAELPACCRGHAVTVAAAESAIAPPTSSR